jgi:hypothetical protein
VTYLQSVDRYGLEHLVLDVDQTLDGACGSALFDQTRSYRYALDRVWDPLRRPAIFIMLNPSTADASILDATLRRVKGFAQSWDCGGFIVLNAFALRATDPKQLRRHPDPVGPDNDRVIGSVLAAHMGPRIVAWGADPAIALHRRAGKILDWIHLGGDQAMCLGKTGRGDPRHPLYLPADTAPIPYPDADAYAAAMNRMA